MASPDSLRQAITFLHMALAEHADPQAKATISQALAQLMKVQANDHAQASQQQSAAQTMFSGLGR